MDNNKQIKIYKHYDVVMAAFVTILLCTNLIGASKVTTVLGYEFGAGTLFFPISYLFGDILTEVYGYANSRKVIWIGFIAMIFASVMSLVIINMPSASSWTDQKAFETVFGTTWRITVGSLFAFWVGEFMNSFVLAKLKIKTSGKKLWLRFILSTVVGQGIDTLIFYPVAFYGIWQTPLLLTVMTHDYFLKIVWEIIAIPLTYLIINFLKRSEQEDYYDYNTNFNPFSNK
ncbi:MAG: queuosine precursor transporter [Candidatus Sericytochromatia bacterium]|nr:queuosine precursor transporter [Candidatus Sericytochromatia bacterium]